MLPFRVYDVAHSAILVQQNDKFHLLEYMANGKVHLRQNVDLLNINAFNTLSDL